MERMESICGREKPGGGGKIRESKVLGRKGWGGRVKGGRNFRGYGDAKGKAIGEQFFLRLCAQLEGPGIQGKSESSSGKKIGPKSVLGVLNLKNQKSQGYEGFFGKEDRQHCRPARA